MRNVLFVGYATVDIIEKKWYAGGAAGAMAIATSGLGVRAHLLAPLADDAYGRFYQRILEAASVDYSLCPTVSHLPTCYISDPLAAGSRRRWSDHGANRHLKRIVISGAAIQSFDAVFIVNSYPDLGEQIAVAQPQYVFYIPGPQAVLQSGYVRERILQKSRVVLGNEEEAPYIFEKKPFAYGVKIVIITHGSRGGKVFVSDGKTIPFRPPLVKKVTDTTGAGDAFALGFGLALLDKQSVQQAISNGKKLVQKTLLKKSS